MCAFQKSESSCLFSIGFRPRNFCVYCVSARLFFNSKKAIVTYIMMETCFDEMFMTSVLCYIDILSWIFKCKLTDKTIHWYIIIYSRSTRTYYLRIKPSLFLLLSDAWFLLEVGWRGSSNTNLVVFGLTWHGIEPTVFITRDDQVYHYTPCVIVWRLSDQWSEVVGDIVNGNRFALYFQVLFNFIFFSQI